MSKLVDKLDNLSRPAGPAMGFHTAGATEKAISMLVAVEITGRPEDEVKDIAGLKAAGGVIDGAGLTAAALSKYAKAAGSMPIGLNVGGGKAVSSWKLVAGDVDFAIFDVNTPVIVLEGKDADSLGKVLSLRFDMESGLLRSVNNLYPDIHAALIDLRLREFTVETMMNSRRVADFAGCHMLALVKVSLSYQELLALRGAGVKGLILPSDSSVDEIKAFIERVEGLPRVEKKKEKRDVVLLPKFGLAPAAKEEEGGDGDGGDDDE